MSSQQATFPAPARFRWIRPRWFLGGLVLGLVVLSLLGRKISRTDYHPNFVRFHEMISPTGNYYPTLSEMCAIVRSKCRPDQILVIVGGDSILLGTWQKEADVWTNRLQELLGDSYCVINFSFRGGSATDCGAVLAETLRGEFPRQILIADDPPITNVLAMGSQPYRYVFWQAYFEGRLITYPQREARIRELVSQDPGERLRLLETRISVWFDTVVHFHDLWNWVTLNYFGTVASPREAYFPLFLKPRRAYPDSEVDGTDPRYDGIHYPPSTLVDEMRIVLGASIYYSRGPDGHWLLAPATRADISNYCDEAMPASLKARTLVLITANSPYYLRRLSEGERQMVAQSVVDSADIWRQSGYSSMDFGQDYSDTDFGDRDHMTKLGGWKLAARVAPEIKAIAGRLGYLR
jgi:hypothetical protein